MFIATPVKVLRRPLESAQSASNKMVDARLRGAEILPFAVLAVARFLATEPGGRVPSSELVAELPKQILPPGDVILALDPLRS